MRSAIPFVAMLSIVLLAACASAEQQRPNIVFMISDDQGWSGLSVAMNPEVAGSKSDLVQTPNLARLASEGMRFSAAYAPAPVCAPTRISLQTGKSPAALHWTKASSSVRASDGYKLITPQNIRSIADSETTVAELLREAGYATAHFGKWHINGGGPGEHGYDEHDGNTGNGNAGRFADPNPADVFGMARRATAFMEEQSEAGKPFFIQMSWYPLHAPQNALQTTKEKYARLAGGNDRRVDRAAIAEDLDTGVGMVSDAIERLGLAENTYVIYMSDNGAGGGRGRSGTLRGGKGSVWEGGIRVPLIVRGPGIKPKSWCHARVVGYDFFPTFCQWAGVASERLPKGIEGGSLVPLLVGEGHGTVRRPREELVFHFPHYQSGDGPHSAIVLGDLKLLKFYEDDHLALFDLSEDLGEQNDLAAKSPEETARLHRLLSAYLADVDAQLPRANPQFDADDPPSRTAGRRDRSDRRGGPRGGRQRGAR